MNSSGFSGYAAQSLALTGFRDTKTFAIFGDGTALDGKSFLLQQACQGVVGQDAIALGGHQGLEAVLDGMGALGGAVFGCQGG